MAFTQSDVDNCVDEVQSVDAGKQQAQLAAVR